MMVLKYYATPRNGRDQPLHNEHHLITKWNARWSNHYRITKNNKNDNFKGSDFPQQSVSVIRQIINDLTVSQTPALVRLVNNQIGGEELRGFLKLTSNDQVEIITIHGTQMYPISAIQSIQ